MKKYYPILLCKAGELAALTHLSETVKQETSPIIQILNENFSSLESFLVQNWSFDQNQILLDFSLLENLSENIPEIEILFNNLIAENVIFIPVIQQNSPLEYYNFLKEFHHNTSTPIAIRASNNSGGFINFQQQLDDITRELELDSSDTVILMDLSHVESSNYTNFAALALLTIKNLLNYIDNWKELIVASGSFPENLSGFVAGNVYHLDRFEWQIWLLLQADPQLKSIVKYSDYGTKNPIFTEANFAGTSSIKYTTREHYVIYRGELPRNHRLGMGQYIDFASILITTPAYSGEDFSWGDKRISEIVAENNRSGNATTWVQISQNHHITLLHSLL